MELALKSKSQCIDNFFRAIVLDLNGNSKSSRLPKFGNPTFTRVVPSARSTLIRKFARVGRWIIKTIHRRTMIQYQVLSPSSSLPPFLIARTHGNQVLPAFRNSKEISRVVLSSKLFNDRVAEKSENFRKKKKMRRGKKQSKAKQNKTKQNIEHDVSTFSLNIRRSLRNSALPFILSFTMPNNFNNISPSVRLSCNLT